MQNFAVDLEFVGWIASDNELISVGRIADSVNSLVIHSEDVFAAGKLFNDTAHEYLGFGELDFMGEWNRNVKITWIDLNFVDITVGNGDDVHAVDVLDFGSEQADGSDGTDIVAKFNNIADFVIITGYNDKTTDDVFKGILQGKADHDTGDTDAGEHGSDVDAAKLENDENDDDPDEADGGTF